MAKKTSKTKNKYESFIDFMKEAEQAESLRENGINSPDSSRVAAAINIVRQTAQKYDPGYTEAKMASPQYVADWIMFYEKFKKENASKAFIADRAEITRDAKGLESIVLTLPETKEKALENVAKAEKEHKSAIELVERTRAGSITEKDVKNIVAYAESYVENHSKDLGEESKKLAMELAKKYALVGDSPVRIVQNLVESSKEKFYKALNAAGKDAKSYATYKVDSMSPEDAGRTVYSAREFGKQDPGAVLAGTIRKALERAA